MLQDLHLPSLQDRRRQLRLAFMYKVVEGKVPAMPSSEFFSPRPQNKRKIRTRTYADCVTTNIVERSAYNNSRAFIVPDSRSDQYRQSFFVQTVVDWNHLDDHTVNAKMLDGFREALAQESSTPRN